MLKKYLIAFMFLATVITVQAKSTSVVLRVLKKGQSDTLGYNIFNYLPNLVYQLINEEKIAVWDAGRQGNKLSAADIRSIEKFNLLSFADVNLIYLYELIEDSGSDTSISIIGLSMGIYKGGGKEMLFGYVFYDELKEYMQPVQMAMNMNGCGSSNLRAVVNNNWFDFSVVNCNGHAVKPSKGKDLKSIVCAAIEKNHITEKLDLTKRVNYNITRVLDGPEIKIKNTNTLLDSIELYIKEHPDQFFSPTVSDSTLHDIHLTAIGVEDMWFQNKSFVYYKPMRLTLLLENAPQQQLTITDLSKIRLVIDFSKFEDFIKQKQYNFTITRINDDEIEVKDSARYYKALIDGNWRQLSKY